MFYVLVFQPVTLWIANISLQLSNQLREHQEEKEEKFPPEDRKKADYKMGNLPPRVITPRLDDSHIPKYSSRMVGWKSTQPYSYEQYCKPNSWERMPASIFTQLGWTPTTMNWEYFWWILIGKKREERERERERERKKKYLWLKWGKSNDCLAFREIVIIV